MQIITSNYSTLPSIGEIKQDFVLFRLVFYHSTFVLHDYSATKYFCSISINEKKPNPEKKSLKKKKSIQLLVEQKVQKREGKE